MTANQVRTYLAVNAWVREQTPGRPYRIAELARLLQADAMSIALALRLNGWRRETLRVTRKNRRQLVTWWVPPGARPPYRRRRGRPSYAEVFNLN